MKTLSFLGLLAAAAFAVAPFQAAEAGHRRGGCGCCSSEVYAAPAAASPAAAATADAPAVAQNQNQGYRSYSYQPGTVPAMNYNNNYYRSSNRRSNQPMWMNGGAKSLGLYH